MSVIRKDVWINRDFSLVLYVNTCFLCSPFWLPWFPRGWPVPPGESLPSLLRPTSSWIVRTFSSCPRGRKNPIESDWWRCADSATYRFFGLVHPRPGLKRPRSCGETQWNRRGRLRYEPPMDILCCVASLDDDWLVCWRWGIDGLVQALRQCLWVATLYFMREPDFLRIFTPYRFTSPVDSRRLN